MFIKKCSVLLVRDVSGITPSSVGCFYNNNCRERLKEHLRSLNLLNLNSNLNLLNLLNYLPDDLSTVAISLGRSTFKKTSYTSHINFLSFCLKHGIIPVGFKIRFHPSLHGAGNNVYRQQVGRTTSSFSRKLMRITLSRMYQKRDDLSVSMNDTRTGLRRLCARSDQPELYNRISHVIHILNSDWFQFLKEIKGHKLQKFNDNT